MEYQHGGDIYSRPVTMDYSENISPLGLPEGVRQELARCLEENTCGVYPDSSCRALREALAQAHGLPGDWMVCGNGASDLIFSLVYALAPGRALVMAPSFLEYSQALEAAGCRTDSFALREETGFSPETDRLCQTIRRAGQEGRPYDLVFLCNPNNPTGLPVKREEVLALAQECGRWGGLLAVDESFCDFLEEEERCSVTGSMTADSSLFVLRAFTKMYAMPGLRLGYAICPDRALRERLARVRQPWPVSGLAQRAGIAALKESGYRERVRALIACERPRLAAELARLGFQVYPSQANFLLFRDPVSGRGEAALYRALLERKILIRSCANYQGLDASFYRICVKSRPENEAFFRELEQVWKEKQRWQRQL